MGERVCIHANPNGPRQQQYAHGLADAFKRHGFAPEVSGDPLKESDIHVVLGPHFAKRHWLNHRTILLDRCYYRGDPDHVSLGWLRPDGGRYWRKGEGRKPPEVKPSKTGNTTIFLCDFGAEVEPADTVRFHPAEPRAGGKTAQGPLIDALRAHDIAIGYNTTALVPAALEGLKVVCKGEQNIMYEPNWLELLPYADWGFHELSDAVAHLCSR